MNNSQRQLEPSRIPIKDLRLEIINLRNQMLHIARRLKQCKSCWKQVYGEGLNNGLLTIRVGRTLVKRHTRAAHLRTTVSGKGGRDGDSR